MSTLAPDNLAPTLETLAQQGEAATAAACMPAGLDVLSEAQRGAWRRVLLGLAKGEGIEEWVVEPVAKGLARAGLDQAAVLRFFDTQGVDELRHRDWFLEYLARHWPQAPQAEPLLVHQLVYDGLFKLIIQQSEQHPLRLLLPLLAYEKTVSHYLTRLLGCTGEGLPVLSAMMKSIRADEARHVAGVGLTCRALVAEQRPDLAERTLLGFLVQLVIWDMDRAAWWKPGLAEHMRTLGLDAEAMRRDNEAVYQEMLGILEGR